MNILIFGFGNRSRSYILKALLISIENPKITVITKKTKPDKEQFPKIQFFNFNDFYKLKNQSYDLTVLSVPSSNQLEILNKLNKDFHKNILLETPVSKNILKVSENLNIKVLEDIKFATEIINIFKNLLNNSSKREIYFIESAHEYHGIALVESLIGKGLMKKKRTINKNSEIELYLESNNSEKIYTTSPSHFDLGYILFQTDTGNYLCGNETSFLDDKKFKNITEYKKLEDMFELKTFNKTVSDNWVRDFSDFRFLGLINFFKDINKINNAQSINDSFRQQQTAKTNKLVVELKKRIYNKMYDSK
jgi:hypothetical protein